MTSARTPLSMLAIALVASAAAACSSKKKDQTVVDAAIGDLGGKPQLATTISILTLGVVCPGSSTAPVTFQVYNIGDAAASVGLRIVADDPTEFTATGTGCALLAPGEACTVSVVLTPKIYGPKTGMVEVSEQVSGQKLNIALTSTSTGGPATFSLSHSTLDFGAVTVGTPSPVMRVTLTKYGSIGASCSLDAAEPLFIVTLASDDFVITSDTCSTSDTPIGGTCVVDVVLRPTTDGPKSAVLAFRASGVTKGVHLTGTGVSAVDASVDSDFQASLDAQ